MNAYMSSNSTNSEWSVLDCVSQFNSITELYYILYFSNNNSFLRATYLVLIYILIECLANQSKNVHQQHRLNFS